MNAYEDYDYAAMQEAEAILNGTTPSTPETYAMVAEWYKPGKVRAVSACVVAKEKHGCNICGYYESDKRSCTSRRSTSFG